MFEYIILCLLIRNASENEGTRFTKLFTSKIRKENENQPTNLEKWKRNLKEVRMRIKNGIEKRINNYTLGEN